VAITIIFTLTDFFHLVWSVYDKDET
jgi:hypothetical protein